MPTTLEELIFSDHLKKYRTDRFQYIRESVGFGSKIVFVHDNFARKAWQVLTDSGVLLIVGYNKLVITAYVANPSQVALLYHHANAKVDRQMMVVAKSNYVYWKNSPNQGGSKMMEGAEKNHTPFTKIA